jgi:hypothetical protein
MDHEILCPIGPEACRRREVVQPHARPLYVSFREFLKDVFGED